MKVGDLFKRLPNPDLPPVPASFPPCCHEQAREVMSEWVKAGRIFSSAELIEEVIKRLERARRKLQPVPDMTG